MTATEKKDEKYRAARGELTADLTLLNLLTRTIPVWTGDIRPLEDATANARAAVVKSLGRFSSAVNDMSQP